MSLAKPLAQSVQRRDQHYAYRAFDRYTVGRRTALLPRRGTLARDYALHQLYYNDHALIFRSAVAGLVKRIQSTPWELSGDNAATYQPLLFDADLGAGWETFLSRLLLPFFRADVGGMMEIIGPGNPADPLIGPPSGIATLNTLCVQPTGDPVYPAIYHGSGGWHKLHRTRVVQVADAVDSDHDGLVGYGDCALSRYAAAAMRDVHMSRYIETFLDDKPLPGMLAMRGITEGQRDEKFEAMLRETARDDGGDYGRTMVFNSLMPDQDIQIEHFAFSGAPEKFDFPAYTELNVKLVALALGVDIQDVWELTGGGIGTGTQSQVLAQKSRGKALGRLLKAVERTMNQALPRGVDFAFQYQDENEDQARADLADTWGRFVAAAPLPDEIKAQVLVNQVEAVRDAYNDLADTARLNDTDPVDVGVGDRAEATDADTPLLTAERAFAPNTFRMQALIKRVHRAVRLPLVPRAAARLLMRQGLRNIGAQVARDGLAEAGVGVAERLERGRPIVDVWLREQTAFINKLLDAFEEQAFTDSELDTRAELWVNKSLRDLYYTAVDEGATRVQRWRWRLGATEEHCITCLLLDGQIHRYSTFKRYGLYPGSSALECGGWRCDCGLERMPPGTPARGNLRRARATVKALHDHPHEEHAA